MRTILILYCILLLSSCQPASKTVKTESITIDTLQGTSLLGTPLIRQQVEEQKDSLQIANYNRAYKTYLKDTTNTDAII